MLACVRISDEIYRAKHSLVIGNKIPYNILDVIVGQKVAVFLFLVDFYFSGVKVSGVKNFFQYQAFGRHQRSRLRSVSGLQYIRHIFRCPDSLSDLEDGSHEDTDHMM